ncbi:hypothetical protein G3569_08230 [Aliifodinibius halophilus]|uniref:Uncharacterized protein n=1 Tax=Fodinibius halophilus TaxID=1736908 RepID=A0A6M1T8J3_9BACT|nr:hypothetical protein [Fodinibius halophilus]
MFRCPASGRIHQGVYVHLSRSNALRRDEFIAALWCAPFKHTSTFRATAGSPPKVLVLLCQGFVAGRESYSDGCRDQTPELNNLLVILNLFQDLFETVRVGLKGQGKVPLWALLEGKALGVIGRGKGG